MAWTCSAHAEGEATTRESNPDGEACLGYCHYYHCYHHCCPYCEFLQRNSQLKEHPLKPVDGGDGGGVYDDGVVASPLMPTDSRRRLGKNVYETVHGVLLDCDHDGMKQFHVGFVRTLCAAEKDAADHRLLVLAYSLKRIVEEDVCDCC